MCSFQDKIIDRKTIIGYKVTLQIKNKYYSPITGIEYKAGKIHTPKNIVKIIFDYY